MLMSLSTELLDLLHFQGVQLGFHAQHYSPPENYRSFIYASLEHYRRVHISPDRQEEFYTIAMAALSDGEERGKRDKVEADRAVERKRAEKG